MISTTTSDEEGGPGLWIEAFEHGVLLNAYVANANSDEQEGPMTVFWHGEVTRERVRALVGEAERLFYDHDIFDSGTLYSFGDEEIVHGPVKFGLDSFFDEKADAFRAELTGRRGDLTLWANVQPQITESYAENIGICFDRRGLYKVAKDFVLTAVSDTTTYREDLVGRLLDQIVITIATQQPPQTPLPGNAL